MSFNQNVKLLIRADLQDFKAYSSARLEQSTGEVWLNANESPWDQSETNQNWNRYPEPQPQILVERLAELYQVQEDQLLVTRGSDECIDILVRLFCEYQKDGIYTFEPTFGMYKIAAQLQGVRYQTFSLKLDEDFKLDIDQFIEETALRTKIIFLCSPNNPTGNALSQSGIEKILQAAQGHSIVVVDEAYIEFSEGESVSRLINRYTHLVVLRTLSKAHGLAGVRVGVMLSNNELISAARKVLAPYPIAKPCVEAVLEVLSHGNLKRLKDQRDLICAERARVFEALGKLNVIEKVWPSSGNFLMFKAREDIYETCVEQGLVLRNLKKMFDDSKMVRMSIGTPEENNLALSMFELLDMAYETA